MGRRVQLATGGFVGDGGPVADQLASLGRRPTVYIARMARRWLQSVKAALLATLILCGGGGLPLLDVVLYHGLAATHSVDQHFESSGTRHGHGEYCKAGSQLPHSPQAAPLELDRSVDTASSCEAGLPITSPRSANLSLLPRPRAPPSLLV